MVTCSAWATGCALLWEPVLVAIEEEQATAMQEALSAYDESLTGNDRQPVAGSLSLSVAGDERHRWRAVSTSP